MKDNEKIFKLKSESIYVIAYIAPNERTTTQLVYACDMATAIDTFRNKLKISGKIIAITKLEKVSNYKDLK